MRRTAALILIASLLSIPFVTPVFGGHALALEATDGGGGNRCPVLDPREGL